MSTDSVQLSGSKKTYKEMINEAYGTNCDEIAQATLKLLLDIGSCGDNHEYYDTDSVKESKRLWALIQSRHLD